jgi:hypothetical protein
MRRLIRLAALIAIGAIAGINMGETLRPLLPLWNGTGDFVTPSEERFFVAKARLPASGEIAYANEKNPTDAVADPEAVKKFYLAQYALTPLVLNPFSRNESIVLRDSPASLDTVLPRGGAVHDLGNGLVIIEQKAK